MATPQEPKSGADHHYVPRFYLKGFTDKKGSLWVYEHGKNAPRESDPKREGHRQNYYTFADRGHPDDSAEKLLSRVESVVAPTIRKLANSQFRPTLRQISELYTFVSIMYVRVPAYRDFINASAAEVAKVHAQEMARDRSSFFKLLDEYEQKTGNTVGDREKLWRFALSDNYTVTQKSDGFNLLLTFQSGLAIAEVFEREYKHDIFYAPPGSYFICCDNPIVTLEPDIKGGAFVGMGVGRPQTEVLFPLNKRACLLMRRHGSGASMPASQKMVDQANNMIMNAAQRYAYGAVGNRRLARIFTERGCKTKYGVNALIPDPGFNESVRGLRHRE